MLPKISKIQELKENQTTAFLIANSKQISSLAFADSEKTYLEKKLKKEQEAYLFRHPNIFFFHKEKG